MRRDLPVNPPTQDTSAMNNGAQEQPAGQNPMALDPPSLDNTASPSPPSTPQIPFQGVNYTNDPISPESQGGSAGVDESRDIRPHTSSGETLQDTSSDVDRDTGGGLVPNAGDGPHEDDQSQDNSRAFIHLVIHPTLVTSRTDMDLRNDSPWSHLEQDDQSSRSTLPISPRSSSGDLELIDGSDLDLRTDDFRSL